MGSMKFGKINIPENHVVYQTKHSYLFVNLRPFLPYHLLASPKAAKSRLTELDREEYVDLMELIYTTIKKLGELGTSWSVVVQDGPAAGQTVPHVHFHMIPRKDRDIARNNEIYKNLDVDVQRPNRTNEEMEQEALFLRAFFETPCQDQ